MAPENKSLMIAELLRRRLDGGEYRFGYLPGAPALAVELGVSYLTVRQAIDVLLRDGVLVRSENKRLCAAGSLESSARRLKVLFLHGQGMAGDNKWRVAIRAIAIEFHCDLDEVIYQDSESPVVFESINDHYDLIFVLTNEYGKLLLRKLCKHKDKVVTLFHDYTRLGIRCLDGFNPEAIRYLIASLKDNGFRRIDFLYIGGGNEVYLSRKFHWEKALREYGCTGKAHVFDLPESESMPAGAWRCTNELLARGKLDCDALFCASVSIARGAIRGLLDHGIDVPRDLSVVSFGEPEIARLNVPSITTVNTPRPEPVIREIFEHHCGVRDDPGKLFFRIELDMVKPEEIIMHGESVNYKKGKRS